MDEQTPSTLLPFGGVVWVTRSVIEVVLAQANKFTGKTIATDSPPRTHLEIAVLLITVFILGFCTLIYELLIGSISSYFLGDSVKQFSLTIGFSLTSMGIGTFLSRFIKRRLLTSLITIEILLGVIGGLSVPALFWAFAIGEIYYPTMIFFIFATGCLIGMELPLLTRIMEHHFTLRQNISNILSIDYVSAFVGALLFPFILLPFLGLFKASLFTGLCNIAVGSFNLWYFRRKLGGRGSKLWLIFSAGCAIILILGVIIAERQLTYAWENMIYKDRVVYSRQSSYQKIVITKRDDDIRLFLDGHLQFSSLDERRYHEPLVHIPAELAMFKQRVLILGGGDGLVAREILRYPQVKHITLVDLDHEVTELAGKNPLLLQINAGSLNDSKVHIVNMDAFQYLKSGQETFDLIIADLPDPRNLSLSKLYTKTFYHLIKKHLSPNGIFVTQATSPYFSQRAFWSIVKTTADVFERSWPYHTYLPSFGMWGFVVAGNLPEAPLIGRLETRTQFLDENIISSLFVFPKDTLQFQSAVLPNTLKYPVIIQYYLQGWSKWN